MSNKISLPAVSVTSYALANAIVASLSRQLVEKGVLTKGEAQEMVTGIIADVRDATSNFHVPEFWFTDLEQLALELGEV